MKLIYFFIVGFVLKTVSAKFYPTPTLWEIYKDQSGNNISLIHSHHRNSCKQKSIKNSIISNGRTNDKYLIRGCFNYIRSTLTTCRCAESGVCAKQSWQAFMTLQCSNTWLETTGISYAFRFLCFNLDDVPTCETKPAWTKWQPLTSNCDVTCKRHFRRRCMNGTYVVGGSFCTGEADKWKDCPVCDTEHSLSRRDANDSAEDLHSILPRSRLRVVPLGPQTERTRSNPSNHVEHSGYFSYWPGFATGFACCVVMVIITAVCVKLAMIMKERRKNRRRNELRMYYAKPNQAWQMKIANQTRTSVKSRTSGHINPAVAGLRDTEENLKNEESSMSNNELYPTVCHHDSGYQADDEMNEKLRTALPQSVVTSSVYNSSHGLMRSPSTHQQVKATHDVTASRDSCFSAGEGNNSTQKTSSNMSSPFISFLKIHGDDAEDDDMSDLPLVPFSYRLRLTAKQRTPATAACYTNREVVNDDDSNKQTKTLDTDVSTN